jgi:DNA processing protein
LESLLEPAVRLLRVRGHNPERDASTPGGVNNLLNHGLDFRMPELAAVPHRLVEVGGTHKEDIEPRSFEQGVEVGQCVDMLELDDAQDPVVDRRHQLRHRPALSIVECATSGKTAQTGRGVPHRLDRRSGELRCICLRDHHARNAEVEVLEDNLAIVFADADERRDISSFGRQDHGIGVAGANAAVLGVKEREIESGQGDDLDSVRGGDRDEDADCGAPRAQSLLNRIVQSHRNPLARMPRVSLFRPHSHSTPLILAKRQQCVTIAVRSARQWLYNRSWVSNRWAERASVTITDRLHATGSPQAASETAFWLAISRVAYIGPARIERLVQTFGALSVAWSASPEELRVALEPRSLSELLAARSRIDPPAELERLARLGIRVAQPGHPSYPRLLAEISGRPSILYVRGDLVPADDASVAVVGTRRATPYGRQAAERIAAELAQAGITVVSGLARGVDAVAHRAALAAGGRTIAVLGSGPDVIYPAEHRSLAEQILESGAILSELPPGAKPDAQNFPARNRIVSGMTLGTLVVEAPARSGALITASFAGDQGREVFVIPGSIFAESAEGTNALLRDGARLVRDGADILEDLGLNVGPGHAATQSQMLLDDNERKLYAALGKEARHIDELAEEAGLPAGAASALMLTMELKGLVRNHGAQYYVLR